MKLNEDEERVLGALADYFGEDQNCLSFGFIADHIYMAPKPVRRAARSLARKGLARYVRGLMDDEGMVAGSGYCATKAGYDLSRKART